MTTEKVKELHKRFIPGITPMLIWIVAAGLISSVFFIRGQYDAIMQGQKDDRKHTDSLVTIIAVRQDNRISSLQDTVKTEIKALRDEMNYRFQLEEVKVYNRPGQVKTILVEEKRENGKLAFIKPN